ncbi:polysaccharide deacetylase family protein [Streptomyces sp. MB09-01]|uniref:polysaccharide deacetylase family protein n=1 Tax=Streptomyces sp. MB09-01 TaxID=3028666 RepID=UPI0029B41FD2|nr:polysaccharide deacetylase family protein [Streptomyces sp. MB09-01]MDX3533079.1 polysaccharide deacetylase family protein [Streptomyces sp. MB09-01]
MEVGRRTALAALLAAGFVPCSGAAVAQPTARAAGEPTADTPAAGEPTAGAPPAGPRPPASLLGSEIRRLPISRKVVALTFNAAWDEAGLDAVLAELRRRKLPATFFPTGEFAEAHPAAVRAMGAAHGLGNHSYSHPYFDEIGTAERAEEVRRADAAIRAASGAEPLPFFRFPYSSTTRQSVADVNDLGYAAIEFTADTNGYLGPKGGMTVDEAVERAVDALTPGAIIQMHVGSTGDGVVLDADALPRIIDAARADGYEVIDLREFLSPPASPAAAGAR